jgi:hypothetical protein
MLRPVLERVQNSRNRQLKHTPRLVTYSQLRRTE